MSAFSWPRKAGMVPDKADPKVRFLSAASCPIPTGISPKTLFSCSVVSAVSCPIHAGTAEKRKPDNADV